MALTGIGTAIGFVMALHGDNVFSSYGIWSSGPVAFNVGEDWTFHQGFIGIAAGVFLIALAAAEVRYRSVNLIPRRDVLLKDLQ